METKPIFELHGEHEQWLNQLSFYTDEVKIMQSRIEEIAAKNTATDVMAQVGHFQNQLIIQKEQIDILSHNIREHEHALQKEINDNPVAADHRKVADHGQNREGMERMDKIFNDLRHELNTFLAKVM